jgi:hypothetical protein
MSLVSVLGCGIWFFPIEEQLYYERLLCRSCQADAIKARTGEHHLTSEGVSTGRDAPVC